MDFFAVVDQVIELLRSRGRVSYRALKVQFHLDDEAMEALKAELIEVHQIAVDQAGTMLVWTGDGGATPDPPPSNPSEAQQPQPRAEPHAPEAERRQLTVLFCDLVDSTALASQLDPEDCGRWSGPIKRLAPEVIQRFEGYIAQYLGDGLLVYFGYPQAHEDDAQRAVRTGLGMVEAMGALQYAPGAGAGGAAGGAPGDSYRPGRRGGDGRGHPPGAVGPGRDAQHCGAAAKPRGPESCGHQRAHPAAGRRGLRPRGAGRPGLERRAHADAGLWRPRGACGRESLRGGQHRGAHAAGRA